MVTVEIVTVGNEVLLGVVLDTNSSYLCRVVRGMGGRVRHIAIVGDEIEAVGAAVNAAINRGANLVFTCGGLGPTDDDLTLAAVARASESPLVLNPDARDFVARRFRELAQQGFVATADLTEARLKMAQLPAGARMIENSIGAAPAMALELKGSLIVSLPGVPAELKAIVEGALQELLGAVFGRGCYREREVTVDCGDESVIAPVLRRATQANPEVYVKSRASHYGEGVKFRILLSASAETPQAAATLLDRAFDDLSRALAGAGIAVLT